MIWLQTFFGLFLLLVANSAGAFPASSHKCEEESSDKGRVCIYTDLVLAEGRLHYVSSDDSLHLPRLDIHMGPEQPNVTLFRPVIASPNELPDQHELQELEGAGDVYLYSAAHSRTWGLHLGEYFPTLSNSLCKHLGRCTADSADGLVLLDLSPKPGGLGSWVQETFKCFSSRPKLRIDDPSLQGKAFLLKRVLAGAGQCRGRTACGSSGDSGEGRTGVSSEQLGLYRQRMAQCFGFSAQREAASNPVEILVVDRYYGSGSHMLNAGQIADALRLRYKGYARVRLCYMEDLDPKDQLQAWSRASLVVHVFGSNLGYWFFVPRNAVAVVVPQHPDLRFSNAAAAQQLASELSPVSNVTWRRVYLSDPIKAHLKWELIWRDPAWQGLTPVQKIGVMESGCRVLLDNPEVHAQCMQWARKYSSVVVPIDKLQEAVDAALRELYSKLRVPVPEGLPEPQQWDAPKHTTRSRGQRLSGGGQPQG